MEKNSVEKSTVLVGVLIVIIVALIGYIGIEKLNDNNKKDLNNEVKETKPLSFVSININPEIELGLDEQDKVVEVTSINADADVLTSDLNLEGLTVEEASDKIIDAAIDTGFLDEYSDENTVVVTTANDNEELRTALEEKVIARLNARFEARKIYPVLVAKGLDDELKAEADSYDISYGKMLIIDRAITLDPTLSKDELVAMDINEIQRKIIDYVKARHDALKESLQDAREAWQAQKTQLKQDYVAKVEQLRANIAEEHKAELQNMTQVQKEEAIKNYLNAKKEEIKNNINAVKEELKAEVKEQVKNYNYPVLNNNADTIKQTIKERIQEKRNR